jgi:hypothetical protein
MSRSALLRNSGMKWEEGRGPGPIRAVDPRPDVVTIQGTFCHEPGDVLQSIRAHNGALARVRSAFVIN